MTNEQKRIKALEERVAIAERQVATCLHACGILTERLAEKEGYPTVIPARALA